MYVRKQVKLVIHTMLPSLWTLVHIGAFVYLSEEMEVDRCCLQIRKLETYIVTMYHLLKSKLFMNSSCHSITGDHLEPHLILRILEVLQSSFRAGHVQVADYTSFHVTLISRFHIYPGTFWIYFCCIAFTVTSMPLKPFLKPAEH